jgi:hypothetical protein
VIEAGEKPGAEPAARGVDRGQVTSRDDLHQQLLHEIFRRGRSPSAAQRVLAQRFPVALAQPPQRGMGRGIIMRSGADDAPAGDRES